MAYDSVHQWQLHLRRAGHALRGSAPEATRIDGLDEGARERWFEEGARQCAALAARIEAQTGSTLDSRRALDFGCGVGRLALPLAERCEHVYGLDVSPAVLREADSNARARNLSNVEWLDAGRLAELSGSYDLVMSMFVFQHIPSREGEQIFAQLLGGLRPGGVGAIHMTLRPGRPLVGMARWARSLIHGLDWSYPYMLMHSYSLNRLGRLLADAGVNEWDARWDTAVADGRTYETVTLVFRKD